MKLFAGLAASLWLVTLPATANDTTAELAAGGLVYVQNDDITMADEKLFISMEKVTVDYVFHNKSDKDVESIVAFPFPDIAGFGEMNIGIPDFESDNFLDFQASQDGQPVTLNLQQRAFALGLDVTDDLVKAGVPLIPFGEKNGAALDKLDAATAADWKKRGMVTVDQYDEGNGMQQHLQPLWNLKSAYWWKTVFPAGKDVNVHHEYKSGTGGTVAVTFLGDNPATTTMAEYKTKYCIDDDFVKSADKATTAAVAAGGYTAFYENWVSYILTTGNNWAGPIGKLTLTVDKGVPDNMVSFCGENVKKIGPTTFQTVRDDYWPEKDLNVLFLVATKG